MPLENPFAKKANLAIKINHKEAKINLAQKGKSKLSHRRLRVPEITIVGAASSGVNQFRLHFSLKNVYHSQKRVKHGLERAH